MTTDIICANADRLAVFEGASQYIFNEKAAPLPAGLTCALCGATGMELWASESFGPVCAAFRSTASKRHGLKDRQEDGTYAGRGGTALEGAAMLVSESRTVIAAQVPVLRPNNRITFRPIIWDAGGAAASASGPRRLRESERLVAETILDPPPPPFRLVVLGRKDGTYKPTEDENWIILNTERGQIGLDRWRLLRSAAACRNAALSRRDAMTLMLAAHLRLTSRPTNRINKDIEALKARIDEAAFGRLLQIVPNAGDPQSEWLLALLSFLEINPDVPLPQLGPAAQAS